MAAKTRANSDVNNAEGPRPTFNSPLVDSTRGRKSLAIPGGEDDITLRTKYRPFLLRGDVAENDWIAKLELDTALQLTQTDMQRTHGNRLKVLVLYGSMRERSYSRLLAYECARILHRLGCDVRVYDPSGLPMKDDVQHDHPKVQELRGMSKWSDGHVWVSPEQHGNIVRLPFRLLRDFES